MRLNRDTGSPETSYTKQGNKFIANVGNYHLDGAYGGYELCRMVGPGGGVSDVFRCGHISKRDLSNRISAMLAGHTPGPWNTDGRFILSGTNPGAPYIADCLPGHEYRTEGSTQANAALIAAAPALLEALRDIVQAHDVKMGKSAVELRIEIARAAIARAEKGQP